MYKSVNLKPLANFELALAALGPAAGGATLLVYKPEAEAKYYYKKYRSDKHHDLFRVASKSLNNYENNSYDG